MKLEALEAQKELASWEKANNGQSGQMAMCYAERFEHYFPAKLSALVFISQAQIEEISHD